MKTKYSIILFVIICLSYSQTKYIASIDKNAEQNVLYKIKKIVDYGLFDVIYAHNNLFFAVNLNGLFLSKNNKDATEIMNKFSIYTIFCYECKNNKFLLRLYLK